MMRMTFIPYINCYIIKHIIYHLNVVILIFEIYITVIRRYPVI